MKDRVVFMDKKNRCRLLVNPPDLSVYKDLPNAVINPPNYDNLLKSGIKPECWIVEDGKLSFNDEITEMSNMTPYDLVADIEGLRNIMTKNRKQTNTMMIIYGVIILLLMVVNISGVIK